jgi:two-component system sensor histidine kinase UhpB
VGVLADTGTTPEALERLREAVRASLEEVRGVARQLRPHVLEDLGLRSALAALTTELFGQGDTLVRRGIMPGLPQLDDARELVVFRVAQEALTNAARHAQAGTVVLSLEVQGNGVVLSVRDDGVGIRPGAMGTGIRGMRERAALVGGTLQITTEDPHGTRVLLTVPTVENVEP